ncbi:Leucyl/phenylalanyl-tRNA--protein transferase [Sphingobacterium sp. JB170]|nr:Leucyl/phenylalanyl-tRNA--protein transferase [Sphingobacterium sp. JB170]
MFQTMVYQLDKRNAFPHPRLANEDGLLAVGGDLSTERLLLAYEHGIFPWYDEASPILWYAPKVRFVLQPNELKISKSMRQFIRSTTLINTHDKAFVSVIENCAQIRRSEEQGTWITDQMQQAYNRLHELGFAHSFETYDQIGNLVGGLYGVQVGNVFCGESMFSKTSNASKLALIYLCQNFSFTLIDCQIYSGHLASLGAKEIDGALFYNELKKQTFSPNELAQTL